MFVGTIFCFCASCPCTAILRSKMIALQCRCRRDDCMGTWSMLQSTGLFCILQRACMSCLETVNFMLHHPTMRHGLFTTCKNETRFWVLCRKCVAMLALISCGLSSQLNFFSCTCGFKVRIQELAISHETLRHHKRMKHAPYIDFTVMNHDVWTRNTHLLYSFIDLI